MGVSFDKSRNKYVARLTHNGKRLYVGRYDSEHVANVALAVKQKQLDKVNTYTINNYALKLEETDTNGSWAKAVKSWFRRRATK